MHCNDPSGFFACSDACEKLDEDDQAKLLDLPVVDESTAPTFGVLEAVAFALGLQDGAAMGEPVESGAREAFVAETGDEAGEYAC